MSLPDEVARDLTLAHSESCGCAIPTATGRGHIGSKCAEVRAILCLAIERAILNARVDTAETVANWLAEKGRRGLPKVSEHVLSLRAQAEALKGGS